MNENYNEIQTASILDKTDWRKSIHRYLDYCIITEGTVFYPGAVNRLKSAVATEFPNWDAKKYINKHIEKLKVIYRAEIKKSVERNPEYWIHPGKRLTIEPDIINEFYKDIFDYIMDLLAKKRMLLWGVKKTPGGTPMDD